MNRRTAISIFAFVTFFSTVDCASAATAEAPIAPEVSPPGDIPDNQAFITYTGPSGYAIKSPEGWARKDQGDTTVFNDKYNHITLTSRLSNQTIVEAFAASTLVADLKKSGRAVSDIKVSSVKLKSGKTIKISFDSNSEPNAVTNKQIREENEKFYYTHNGKVLELTLSAPKGADNVDQWNLISSSFKWK